MNIVHYGSGATGDMIRVLLTAGTIPYKHLDFFDANIETLRKRIRAYVDQKVMYKTVYFKTKERAIYLAPIQRLPKELLSAFDPDVIKNYEENILQDRDRAIHRDGDRAEKNAEAIMMMMAAGVPTAYNEKPHAGGTESLAGVEAFYSAREVKQMNPDDYAESLSGRVLENEIQQGRKKNKKTMGARAHGLYVCDEGSGYVFYVVGKGSIQWSARGENAHKRYVNDRLRGRGREAGEIKSAIFTYSGVNGILQIFQAAKKRTGYLRADDSVYDEMFFLPRNRVGTAMLEMMRNAGWKEEMLHLTVSQENRDRAEKVSQSCDGQTEDGALIFAFCVPDLKRLRKFYDGLLTQKKWQDLDEKNAGKTMAVIVCFDFQEEFIRRAFDKVLGVCKIETVPFWSAYNKFYESSD